MSPRRILARTLGKYLEGMKPKEPVETSQQTYSKIDSSFEECVLVIHISILEEEKPRLAFKYIEAITHVEIPFLGWGRIYRKLHIEEYKYVIPHNDPKIRE
jgi:hypothetical protein